jgi:hypothetical protein
MFIFFDITGYLLKFIVLYARLAVNNITINIEEISFDKDTND